MGLVLQGCAGSQGFPARVCAVRLFQLMLVPPVQHDDREGEGADKWVNRGRGRGAFPRGRGRFMFRKSSTSPKWAHDKFSGEEGEIEDDESGAENREEKDNMQTTAE